LRPTGNEIIELGVDDDTKYLFWTVVQAVKDYVFYPTRSHRHAMYHRLARKWIIDPNYTVEWGECEEPIRFTFGEALELLGVHSENVDVFRETIISARKAKTDEERVKIVQRVYGELHFHNNEPDLWRCLNGPEQVSSF
jgi:hypothetical protein